MFRTFALLYKDKDQNHHCQTQIIADKATNEDETQTIKMDSIGNASVF